MEVAIVSVQSPARRAKGEEPAMKLAIVVCVGGFRDRGVAIGIYIGGFPDYGPLVRGDGQAPATLWSTYAVSAAIRRSGRPRWRS